MEPMSLTEREKETLRLLLRGHDAKSIARELELSVHTVNDRLRDARRKLNVSSSREAARRLAEAEGDRPKIPAGNELGVAPERTQPPGEARTKLLQNGGYRFAWLAGGMLIMSLFIAVAALSLAFNGHTASGSEAAQQAAPTAASSIPVDPAATDAARSWVALLDSQQWGESWRATASLFRSQMSAEQWTAKVQPLRQALGATSSRTVQSATRSAALPGAPIGDYEVIQFKTSFANNPGSVETVALARDGTGWRVAGYFIR